MRSFDPGVATLWANDDIKTWSQNRGVLPNNWKGCDGVCFLNVPAAGFAFECSDPVTKHIEYANYTEAGALLNSYHNGSLHNSSLHLDAPLFEISFDASYSNTYDTSSTSNSYITMHITCTQAIDSTNEKGWV